MDNSHATHEYLYLSPPELLKSYHPVEVPFSVPAEAEEEIGERESDGVPGLVPIDFPDAAGDVDSVHLDLVGDSGGEMGVEEEDDDEEEEEEISIIPIDVSDSYGDVYSAPLDLEEDTREKLEEDDDDDEGGISIVPISIPIPDLSSINYSSPPEDPPNSTSNEPHDTLLHAPASSPKPKPYTPYATHYTLPSPRSTIITHKDMGFLSSAGIRGSVSTVCHGTYDSQPATLLLFTFIFRSGDHGFRFKNASVKIEFSACTPPSPSSSSSSSPCPPAPKNTSRTPTIAALAPRKIYGLPSTSQQTRKISGEISLQIPLGPTSLGPSTSVSHESSFARAHRYAMVGNPWARAGAASWDSVYWDIRENRLTKGGIPDRVDVGVVVWREGAGAFQAEVGVQVDMPVLRGVWGWPWGRERPVVFVEGVETGVGGEGGRERVRTRRFEELGEGDWRALVGLGEEGEGVEEGVDVVVGGRN
ncbi:hypothetical protein EAE96_009888 [Botrytis aclada]|nr:hypothetical protein EAE96_009888 [Botrytis aclada]